jgi:NADH-quinone oxidoreductase subunit E
MNNMIDGILQPFPKQQGSLIPMLQAVQEHFGYLSKDSIFKVADALDLSPHTVYGVATFYTQFRFNRPGEHEIKVCLGTACHVRGGDNVMGVIERSLSISHGETTKDGKFSLDRVACMGCCALAPVLVVDDKIFGNVTAGRAEEAINHYRSGGETK